MNPLFIKIGISAVVTAVSAAVFLYTVWRNQTNISDSTYTYRNSTNYDGSNITRCCICLTDFKSLKKNEVIFLPCNHKVCRKCCKKMFDFQVRNKRNCPQCRQIIPEVFVSSII